MEQEQAAELMADEVLQQWPLSRLTGDARDKAIQRLTVMEPWGWQQEWWDSAMAFEKIAPVRIDSAVYDTRHVSVTWTGDEDVAELSGVRAWKWLLNNGWFDWAKASAEGSCTMTGFCGDCPFADPIVAVKDHPNKIQDLRQLFYECAQAWVNAAADDMDHAYSDEGLEEWAEANDWLFDREGELLT